MNKHVRSSFLRLPSFGERTTGSMPKESDDMPATPAKHDVFFNTGTAMDAYTGSLEKRTGIVHIMKTPQTGDYEAPYAEYRPAPSRQFVKAMRPLFLTPILKSLHDIQEYVGTAGAAMYVEQILKKVCEMHEALPNDSIIEVLRALYDSMVQEANWVTYNAKQYQGAYDILGVLSKKFPVTKRQYEKAILKLDEIGFDTLPFTLVEEE